MEFLKSHLQLMAYDEIKQIIAPLKEAFYIDNFYYIQIDKAGDKRIILSSTVDWLSYFYKKELFKQNFFARAEYLQSRSYYIWTDYYDYAPFQDAKLFGLYSGITIIEESKNLTHIYCFGSSNQEIIHIENYYLHILDTLQKFITYFHNTFISLSQLKFAIAS
jgi:hypothetical protein